MKSKSNKKKRTKKCCRNNHWLSMTILITFVLFLSADLTRRYREEMFIQKHGIKTETTVENKRSIFDAFGSEPEGDQNSELHSVLFKEEHLDPDSIRGIYVTASSAATRLDDLADALIAAGGNALVMDIEVSGGRLAFEPKNDYLKSINPGSATLKDLRSMIRHLHRKGIYVIARQVIFNDPFTASVKPEWRIHYKTGALFDARWLDPSRPDVQNYNLLITREVAEMGFDEIQYDYIRFPDNYHDTLDYQYDETKQERWEIINNFLKQAKLITEEHDIKLGMDVFGATIWGNIDWDIVGQYIPEVAKSVDVIYPMTYPSHVSPGYYGFVNPYGDPYSFVHDSIERFIEASDGHAEIRPWIQGFPLRIPNYGDWFVKGQIQANYDAGSRGFVVWNPSNTYSTSWSSLGIEPKPNASPTGEPF